MYEVNTHIVRAITVKCNRLISITTPIELINKMPFVTVSIGVSLLSDKWAIYIMSDSAKAVAFSQVIEFEGSPSSLSLDEFDVKIDGIIQQYLNTLKMGIRIYTHPRLAPEISSDDYPTSEMAKDIAIYLMTNTDTEIDTALYGKMLMDLDSDVANHLTRFEQTGGVLGIVLGNTRIRVEGCATPEDAIEWFLNAVKTNDEQLAEQLHNIRNRHTSPLYRYIEYTKSEKVLSVPALKLVSNKETDDGL